DQDRAPIIKQMFEKVAYDKYSGRKVYHWLLHEMNFKTKGNKTLSLSGVHRVLNNSFYYGRFEFPKGSGNWYEGKHKPIITQALFEKAQEQLQRDNIVKVNKEFAFTKLMTCGMCESGICAQEKYKQLKDGTHAKYIYYGCTRGKDRHCKNNYIREEELITQLVKIIDKMDIDALGIKCHLEDELKRFSKFQRIVLGSDNDVSKEKQEEINVRTYAKYLLREGSITEKRFLLGNLKSKLIYENRTVSLLAE
ncbi:MAG: recombinase family protein, partial [bacterium]|nr:recombinase family protein [bacterium]